MSYFNLHEKHFKDKICLFVPNKTSLLEPEQARHVGVVCKKLHVAQPEVGINISLSDEGDIIEFSMFY